MMEKVVIYGLVFILKAVVTVGEGDKRQFFIQQLRRSALRPFVNNFGTKL